MKGNSLRGPSTRNILGVGEGKGLDDPDLEHQGGRTAELSEQAEEGQEPEPGEQWLCPQFECQPALLQGVLKWEYNNVLTLSLLRISACWWPEERKL